jgi:hypothetical protein
MRRKTSLIASVLRLLRVSERDVKRMNWLGHFGEKRVTTFFSSVESYRGIECWILLNDHFATECRKYFGYREVVLTI